MYNKVNTKENEKNQNDVVRPIYSICFIAVLIFLSITYAYLAIGIDIGKRGVSPAHEKKSNKKSNISNVISNVVISNSNSNEPSNSNSESNPEPPKPSNSNSVSNPEPPKPSNSNSTSNPEPPKPSNSNSNSNPIPPTPIDKPEWKIIFDNVVMDSGSIIPITSPTLDSKKTSVSYEVDLSAPGEYFAFDVDMVNKGTIDAKIYDIIEQGLTSRQKRYLDYTIKYKNGNNISRGDILLAGQRKTVNVWLKFKDDLTKEDLPNTDEILKLKYQVVYVEN